MVRRLLAVWLVVALVIVVGVLASASCATFPDGECRADDMNALAKRPILAPADASATECTSCVQRRCCDKVGACSNTEGSGCPDQVLATHACVLDGGQRAEATCKGALTSQESKELYACERESCGKQCKIPSCNLNAAVNVVVSIGCDTCVSGACCDAVNSCYENRPCKLFLDCVSEKCPNSFGPSLTGASLQPPGLLEQTQALVCDGGAPPLNARAAACFVKCLDIYAPAVGTVDDRAARCRAYELFTCASRAGCGTDCKLTPPVTEGVYPEDLIDAGAEAGPDAGTP